MLEDITIGVGLFLVLWLAAVIGRKINVPHIDIWSAS